MGINEGRLRSVIGDLENRPAKSPHVVCGGCRRRPHDIPDLQETADGNQGEPVRDLDAWIRKEEGTYNPETNRFLCDECYIRAGTPSQDYRPGQPGWRCP